MCAQGQRDLRVDGAAGVSQGGERAAEEGHGRGKGRLRGKAAATAGEGAE